jgi:two-component system, NtrC family, nitrogen regulation response regulator NtrX
MKHSILIVDDELGIRQSLGDVLRDEGYRVEAVESGETCLDLLGQKNFDVVLLDIWLPGIDGLETLERTQALGNRPAVIMISGHGTIETAVRATKLGAFDFIEKPLSIDKTLLTVKHALEQVQLAAQNRHLREELRGKSNIIGDSIPMKALRQQLALAAPTNGRVLVYGESGVGKELVAHALHDSGTRGERAFVEVNCAAIPEELIESELFGHLKGSFTGAHEDKTGKFEQADGGTLFLDEVGDMSLRTQSKVLRVIEEQRFTPVGSGTNLTVDVRIIAATNKDLPGEIQKGNFREDLFYRLNVITIELPPLRQRKEDIPLLVDFFLKKYAEENGRSVPRVTTEALRPLMAYSWPGNVRELENVIERAVVLSNGTDISVDLLPDSMLGRGSSFSMHDPPADVSLFEIVEDVERRVITDMLERCNWNQTEAAERFHVPLSTLNQKIRRLNIEIKKKGRG